MSGTDVVAEGIPGLSHRRGARPGQAGERGIAPEELLVLRDHALHLGLLEHDLGDEDVVGIVGVPPRQVTAVPAVPAEQPSLEALANRHVWKRQVAHADHCDRLAQGSQVHIPRRRVKNEAMPNQMALTALHLGQGAVTEETCGWVLPGRYGGA